MALFNKLFSSRKKSCAKYQDNVCDSLFSFTNDQVRVVLFTECDFRGRKLLFDSQTVQKVPLVNTGGQQDASGAAGEAQKEASKYVEICNGYGYLYTKPNGDVTQLGEMIFGSVAMSYRGTSYKIHSLTSPARLMCTQVFQSPTHPDRRGRSSAPSRTYMHSGARVSSQSLEHSLRLEDSNASTTSFSDHSVHSTASDTLLVCRGNRSIPLDVPQTQTRVASSISNSSLVGDSGFCGEQSYSSTSSGPRSVPTCDANKCVTFSCGSLYKRWLRSASTSLEYSASSLTGSASADECFAKPHPRTSKLGLAVVIKYSNDQEERLEQFLMDHAALVEGMVWRARQGAETAYMRHAHFLSLMTEVAARTAQWLVNLLSGPQLSAHMWLTISTSCDSSYSIIDNSYSHNSNNNNNDKVPSVKNGHFSSNGDLTAPSPWKNVDFSVLNGSFKSDLTSSCESTNGFDRGSEFTFLNITRFLKSEWDSLGGSKKSFACADKNFVAEKFVRELCELLESVDVKHTNFFMSTLITAVLTHHLGWVATSLKPSANDEEFLSKLQNTGNPLWGQLNDLYGAVGHPTKMAHTLVTGSNKSELITKILNTLTYFIRCSDVERKCVARRDAETENFAVNRICHEKSCIPKENYKKYEDHLKEIAANNVSSKKFEERKIGDNEVGGKFDLSDISAVKFSDLKRKDELRRCRKLGLTRTNTCVSDLSKLLDGSEEFGVSGGASNLQKSEVSDLKLSEDKVEAKHEIMHRITTLGLQAIHSPPLENEICFDFCKGGVQSSDFCKGEVKPSDFHKEGVTRTLSRMSKSDILYSLDAATEEDSLVNICEAKEQVEKIFSAKKIKKRKSCMKSLNEIWNLQSVNPEDEEEISSEKENVVFLLGENEELVGLRKSPNKAEASSSLWPSESETSSNLKKNKRFATPRKLSLGTCDPTCSLTGLKLQRPTTLRIPDKKAKGFCDSPETLDSSSFKDCDFIQYEGTYSVKPSTSWTELNLHQIKSTSRKYEPVGATYSTSASKDKEFSRSQSVPPEGCGKPNGKSESTPRYRYTGVKFNFQQHPQIFQNYMRSKNIELSNLSFSDKALKFNNTLANDYNFSDCQGDLMEVETLQTPSNASELEFTSELVVEKHDVQQAKEVIDEMPKTFVRNTIPNAVIREANLEERNNSEGVVGKETMLSKKMRIIEIPIPKTSHLVPATLPTAYTCSLFRGLGEHYISDMVLQGTSSPKAHWETFLRKDLTLAVRHPILDHPVEEAVAIVANTDAWEVHLMSSHTYVIDKGSSGVRVGMSQLVANMLESLLHMWKLRTPPEYCLMHIEERLQEFCTRSKALAQLLLATDFCSMELLTSALQLEVNDVPLLMAVASTHSPQITQKYGLSFQ